MIELPRCTDRAANRRKSDRRYWLEGAPFGRVFRPNIDGLALLKAQRLSRRATEPRFGARGYVYVVGGFVQVTSVSSHGVNSEILHWWPDELGRRIEPQAS